VTGPRADGRSGGHSTAQQVAERALELSRADGAVVLVDESSTANLRWANNTLTTNGVATGRTVTVISTVNGAQGTSAAVLARSGVDLDTVEDLVRASERAAGEAGPAEDAQPLPGSPSGAACAEWDDGPAVTSIDVFGSFAPALGEAFEAARARSLLYYEGDRHRARYLRWIQVAKERHEGGGAKAVADRSARPLAAAQTADPSVIDYRSQVVHAYLLHIRCRSRADVHVHIFNIVRLRWVHTTGLKMDR